MPTSRHEVLGRMLDTAATCDMLNLNRRRQLIEEAVIEDPNSPTSLQAPVAAERGTEAAISKERRGVREARVAEGKRKLYEHEVLSRALDIAATCDLLDLKNMAWVEYAFRRLQSIEEAVSEDTPLHES